MTHPTPASPSLLPSEYICIEVGRAVLDDEQPYAVPSSGGEDVPYSGDVAGGPATTARLLEESVVASVEKAAAKNLAWLLPSYQTPESSSYNNQYMPV